MYVVKSGKITKKMEDELPILHNTMPKGEDSPRFVSVK